MLTGKTKMHKTIRNNNTKIEPPYDTKKDVTSKKKIQENVEPPTPSYDDGVTADNTAIPNRSPLEVLPQILWLLTQSPKHKYLFLADLKWYLMALGSSVYFSRTAPYRVCELGLRF